MHVQTFN